MIKDTERAATRAAAAERKRRSRARLAALDIKVLEIPLSARERAQMDEARTVRGGDAGPYELTEYIATLIRRDHERLAQQLADLGDCAHCKQALPAGCGGTFKGQGECWHTAGAADLLL